MILSQKIRRELATLFYISIALDHDVFKMFQYARRHRRFLVFSQTDILVSAVRFDEAFQDVKVKRGYFLIHHEAYGIYQVKVDTIKRMHAASHGKFQMIG